MGPLFRCHGLRSSAPNLNSIPWTPCLRDFPFGSVPTHRTARDAGASDAVLSGIWETWRHPIALVHVLTMANCPVTISNKRWRAYARLRIAGQGRIELKLDAVLLELEARAHAAVRHPTGGWAAAGWVPRSPLLQSRRSCPGSLTPDPAGDGLSLLALFSSCLQIVLVRFDGFRLCSGGCSRGELRLCY